MHISIKLYFCQTISTNILLLFFLNLITFLMSFSGGWVSDMGYRPILTKSAIVHIPSCFVSHYCSRPAQMCSHQLFKSMQLLLHYPPQNAFIWSPASPLHHFTQTHTHTYKTTYLKSNITIT